MQKLLFILTLASICTSIQTQLLQNAPAKSDLNKFKNHLSGSTFKEYCHQTEAAVKNLRIDFEKQENKIKELEAGIPLIYY